MTITPNDLKTNIYTSGMYSAGGSTHPGPAVKNAKGVIGTAESKNDHFMLAPGHKVSFTLQDDEKQKKVKAVKFGPPKDKAPGNAVYLMFFQNNICSAIVPRKDVDYFFTDALSGCAVFIDTLENDDLVLYHANAMSHAPKPEDLAKNCAAESDKAVSTMKEYHDKALKAAYPKATKNVALFKKEYLSKGQAFVDRMKQLGRKDATWRGGTNVIGFRVGSGWEFYYQTWAQASDDKNATREVIACERFFK
jgi:hypothetical protein